MPRVCFVHQCYVEKNVDDIPIARDFTLLYNKNNLDYLYKYETFLKTILIDNANVRLIPIERQNITTISFRIEKLRYISMIIFFKFMLQKPELVYMFYCHI